MNNQVITDYPTATKSDIGDILKLFQEVKLLKTQKELFNLNELIRLAKRNTKGSAFNLEPGVSKSSFILNHSTRKLANADKLKERITKAKEYRVYNSHKGYTNLVKRTDAQLEELSKYEGAATKSDIGDILKLFQEVKLLKTQKELFNLNELIRLAKRNTKGSAFNLEPGVSKSSFILNHSTRKLANADKLKERITKAKEYRVYNSHKGYTNLVKRTDAQLEELSKYEGGTFLSYILVILETCVFSFVR
ncbi:15231_t:CDS:2 [Entrophospora sp. SA101]|nr:15231_t:CDS:2 [Entrophospora sp. SA101]